MDQANRPEGRLADVQSGWEVYSSDEQKVGSVDGIESGYILAHKGIIFPKDLFIPRSAIRRIEHDRVYLNITKDEIENQGWDMEPAGTAGATTPTAGWGAAREAPASGRRERDTMPAAPREGEQTLQLHEEQLRVNKERVQTGEVRVGKEVVEEQKTITVPVTREELVIERIPGDRRPDAQAIDANARETIRVPLTEERVDVEKQTVETEEIKVGTREVTENRQVTDTVRHEEARIEETGNVRVQGDTQTSRPGQATPRRPRDQR